MHDVAAATRWFAQWSCYRAIVDHDWMSHAATCEHVLAHDFPETEAFILEAAAFAGFDTSSPLLFADCSGFHRLLRFPVVKGAA